MTRNISLLFFIFILTLLGGNSAYAQDETYDFMAWQEAGANIVCDGWGTYPSITNGETASNVTVNGSTIAGLHNLFSTRFAFRYESGKGWYLNRENS